MLAFKPTTVFSLSPSTQSDQQRRTTTTLHLPRPTPNPTAVLQSISLLLDPHPISPSNDAYPDLSPLIPKLPASLESLYRTCASLVSHQQTVDLILGRLKLELEKGASSIGKWLRVFVDSSADVEGEPWLREIDKSWGWWKGRVQIVSSLLAPILKPIAAFRLLADQTFAQIVFENPFVQETSVRSLDRWILQDRQSGPLPSRSLLASLPPLHALIQPTIPQSASTHYTQLHLTLFTPSVPILTLLTQTTSCLKNEVSLLSTLTVPPEQSSAILDQVARDMVGGKGVMDGVVDRCLAEWTILRPFEVLEDGSPRWGEESVQHEGLQMLARLARMVGAAVVLRNKVGAWVGGSVGRLIADSSKDGSMIDTLLILKSELDRLIADSLAIRVWAEDGSVRLEKDKLLADAVRSGFERGLQSRGARGAELIAKAMDNLLRSRSTSSDELENDLDRLMDLVRSVRDKDVFKAFYVNALAKRLLLGKSASDDAELSMIARLKKELGEDFITGDGMMADLNLSSELMRSYRLKHDPSEDSDLSVAVLSSANWPTYPAMTDGWTSFVLPNSLSAPLQTFKQFYTQSHQSRLLDYRYQLFSMTLKAKFPLGVKELSVSLFQGLVLLAFNELTAETDRLGWEELADKTGIEETELSRTLQSLACGKVRVLTKHPQGKDVLQIDSFSFNDKFTHPRIKIKINQIQQNQTVEEDTQTENRVMHDRSHLLDAAIVRIMKSKKTCTWNELTNLCVDAVRNKFPPEPKAIKQQIESLLEREYLARDESDPMKVLHYLA